MSKELKSFFLVTLFRVTFFLSVAYLTVVNLAWIGRTVTPNWYQTQAVPKFGLQSCWVTGACHYTRLYLRNSSHGDRSTRLFDGHRGFFNGQWPLTSCYFKRWYLFLSTLVLLKYQYAIGVLLIWSPPYLAAFLFGLRISALFNGLRMSTPYSI